MGWLDKLKRKSPKKQKWAQMLNGYTPIFSQFGTNIYASDVVQQAVKCIVDEMKKLNPTHIRYNRNDPVPVSGTIQTLLNDPNPVMTTSEFLEKITWLLLLNYNAFILPTYYIYTNKDGTQVRVYDGLYPLKPTFVEFIEDESNRLYVKMRFENNFETTIPYSDLIHIKYNYSVNEYMGGDVSGQPDHKPVLDTLQLNQTLLEGVAKAMKASYAVNGVVKYNTMLDDGKTEAAMQELETKLRNSESGFLPLDLKSEFTPLERSTQLVDEATLKFIDEKILRNWGVPLSILTGDYTKEQYAAFYQKTLEPLIISISQAFTKKLFTRRERAFGNEIRLYPKDLIFMTVDQTLEMVNMLSNTGSIYENEKRVAFGLQPLPELEGKRYMSLNWVDVDIANQYQMNNKTGKGSANDGGGENKNEE
ncbi:phage portal protein [Anaerobutyricum hallii]|uniref:phage portal protein n=1 Tax=Anaerobutyricum hallii TaxID=39488 RepID=UPI0024901725|nr:phage portal protein [Anaerobutyricum hallii]